MAFYNNIGDLWGDIKKIGSGHNPMNNDPVRGAPPIGPTGSPTIPSRPNTGGTSFQMPQTNAGSGVTNPDPTAPGGDGGDDGGAWGWLSGLLGDAGGYLKDHAGDILSAGGNAASAVADYQIKQQALKQAQQNADRNYGLASNSQQMQASRALNAAPLVDRGMYLAQNYAAPTAFKPRDITQGIDQFRRGPSGGAEAQVAANQAASANYKAGAGGYDTDTLKAVLAHLGVAPAPPETPYTKPNGTLKWDA